MELQQCWAHYVKAEQLLKQGHWPEAHYLFEQVLDSMPEHVQRALDKPQTKPYEFSCLITGLRDAAITQSKLLNQMGQFSKAFDVLNQTYAQIQFISLEQSQLVIALDSVLQQHTEELLQQLAIFCSSQRSAQWMLEFEHLQKAHHYFAQLRCHRLAISHHPLLN
ncbi:hypothetical protein DZ860_01570 [Vibrio sinensis]|uniref:Tetratricopeptide repeat protein n=1 Tax=Vibrio sinensis TaxID=2302434 RepID=A0A3A6R2N4_9VIBR|nr:hypothetical protein [Vibrio sinensis]RJX75397.1 hypothetical protein DZ860_01570 [Vibrio sinensis]